MAAVRSVFNFGLLPTASMALGLCLAVPCHSSAATQPDFRIAHKALQITGTKTDITRDPEDQARGSITTESLTIDTFPASLELAAFLDNWAIYTYPGIRDAALMIGYSGWSGFEVGPLVSVSYGKTDRKFGNGNKEEFEGSREPRGLLGNEYSLGGYAFYGISLGATGTFGLEFMLSAWHSILEGKTQLRAAVGTNTTTTEKVNGSSNTAALEVTIPITIADKFEYAPGIEVRWSQADDSITNSDGNDFENQTTSLIWGVTLAKLRYTF